MRIQESKEAMLIGIWGEEEGEEDGKRVTKDKQWDGGVEMIR